MGDAEEAPEAVHPNQGMANSLPLPTKFDGTSKLNQADLWPKWPRHFERYRIASVLQNKTEQEQVGILLYAMGECADDVITTLFMSKETASYTDIRASLNGYYFVAAQRNTTVERARFNTRKQTPEESVDTFIQDLYRIAGDCEYGTLKDQLICDRIVVSKSPQRHTIRSLTSKIRPHTCRCRSHDLPSRSKKTEPHSRSRREA